MEHVISAGQSGTKGGPRAGMLQVPLNRFMFLYLLVNIAWIRRRASWHAMCFIGWSTNRHGD